ncbi:hypothetical protein EGM70_15595 [Enterobacteriaceae bacterium 89]|nr:hypothetical protein [Enterobacteriaceae bacterium 89]
MPGGGETPYRAYKSRHDKRSASGRNSSKKGGLRVSQSDGVEHFFSAIFIYAGKGNPYANVFFFC